jgi:hypothetical protein
MPCGHPGTSPPNCLAGKPESAKSDSCIAHHLENVGLLLHPNAEACPMTLNILLIQPIVALIAGILILLRPRLLNYIVAIYLIVVGVTGLWPHFLR